MTNKKSDLKILEAVLDWSSGSKTKKGKEKNKSDEHLKKIHFITSLHFHTIQSMMSERKSKVLGFMYNTFKEMGIPEISSSSPSKQQKYPGKSKHKPSISSPPTIVDEGTNFVQQEHRIHLVKQGDTELDLSNSSLKTVPTSVFELKHLKKLDLSKNKLTKIPNEISQLEELSTLILSHNKLVEINKGVLEPLFKLTQIFIDHNEFPTENPLSRVHASDSGEKVLFLVKNLAWAMELKQASVSGSMSENLQTFWKQAPYSHLKYMQDVTFQCLQNDNDSASKFFVDKIDILPEKEGEFYPLHTECKEHLTLFNHSNSVVKYRFPNFTNEVFELTAEPRSGSLSKGKIGNVSITVKLFCSTSLNVIL